MQIYFSLLYFFTYGILGWCTEVAYAAVVEKTFVNRGFLNGPICPIYGVGVSVVLYFLTPLSGNLVFLYLASTVLVTVLEGITGYVMDKIFHHKWWDYTNRPFNIGGYVCLLFSMIWGVACVMIVKIIHPGIARVIGWIPVWAGIVLLVLSGGILLADLCVTTSEILKFNRRLEKMEEIAGELRVLSDKLGENIYRNVTGTMEIGEEGKKKLETMVTEHRERAEEYKKELRERYEEMAAHREKAVSRLLKAFPGMESRIHKDIFEEWRKRKKE